MLELIQIFVDNIVPILVVASVGYFAGKKLGVAPKPIGSLLYNILSPSLIFYSLYTSEIDGQQFISFYSTAIVFLVLLAILAMNLVKLIPGKVPPAQRGSLILGSYSLNAGNYGLSLISFAFGPEVLSWAAIMFVANTTVSYTLGVYVASGGQSSPVESFKNVLRAPAVYAVIGAFVARGFSLELPLAFMRPVNLLAEASIPMMLLMLGLQLGRATRVTQWRLVSLGVVLKLLVAPVLALIMMELTQFGVDARTAFIMQASMPTAVLTIILATEFDLDSDLSLSFIMVSTFLSPITLSLLIYFLR